MPEPLDTPQQERLHQAARERIEFFTRDLRERYGIEVRMAAELEFLVLDEKGGRASNLVDAERLTNAFSNVPTIEKVYPEYFGYSQLELVTGINPNIPGLDYTVSSPLNTADTVAAFRTIADAQLRDWGLGGISNAARPFSSEAKTPTNGFHLNISLLDTNGNPLFFDAQQGMSDIARHVTSSLIATQAEGSYAVMPHDNSYERLRIADNAILTGNVDEALHGRANWMPSHAGYLDNKGATLNMAISQTIGTVHALANNNPDPERMPVGTIASHYPDLEARIIGYFDPSQRTIPIGGERPHQTRLENRIAGADADPYMLVAMDMASIHEAVTDNVRVLEPGGEVDPSKERIIETDGKRLAITRHDGQFGSYQLPRDLDTARSRFESSERMRSLLGDELYQEALRQPRSLLPLASLRLPESEVRADILRAFSQAESPVIPAEARSGISKTVPSKALSTGRVGVGAGMSALSLSNRLTGTEHSNHRAAGGIRETASNVGLVTDIANFSMGVLQPLADIAPSLRSIAPAITSTAETISSIAPRISIPTAVLAGTADATARFAAGDERGGSGSIGGTIGGLIAGAKAGAVGGAAMGPGGALILGAAGAFSGAILGEDITKLGYDLIEKTGEIARENRQERWNQYGASLVSEVIALVPTGHTSHVLNPELRRIAELKASVLALAEKRYQLEERQASGQPLNEHERVEFLGLSHHIEEQGSALIRKAVQYAAVTLENVPPEVAQAHIKRQLGHAIHEVALIEGKEQRDILEKGTKEAEVIYSALDQVQKTQISDPAYHDASRLQHLPNIHSTSDQKSQIF